MTISFADILHNNVFQFTRESVAHYIVKNNKNLTTKGLLSAVPKKEILPALPNFDKLKKGLLSGFQFSAKKNIVQFSDAHKINRCNCPMCI